MVNRNLLRQFDLADAEAQEEFESVFRDEETGQPIALQGKYIGQGPDFEVNKIVTGRVANLVGDDVVVDVGYKSEGIIPLQEWYDEGEDKIKPPQVGDEIQVLLDAVEDES